MKKNLKQTQKNKRIWGLATRLEHRRIKEKKK
jgi:hypothetical protein